MNIDFGYSSDSSDDDYYLYDQKEYNLRRNMRRFLYTACELDNMSLSSNPQDMANFLHEINAKYQFNIPVELEDIKKKLAKSENRRRKKFQKLFDHKIILKPGVQEKSKSSIIKKKRSPRKRKLFYPRSPNSHFLFPLTCTNVNNQETMFHFLSKNYSSPNEASTSSGTISTPSSTCNLTGQHHLHQVNDDFVNPEATSSGISSPSTYNLTDQDRLHQVMILNNDDAVPERQLLDHEVPFPVIHEEAILVFRKSLSSTDSSDHHQRLLIPRLQVLNEFLTLEEERILQGRAAIAAKLFDSNNVEYDINLRMNKVGKSSLCYAIGKPWNEIRKNNGFGEGTNVQLLAFRRNGTELCFNLLRDD